jgi:hypothetical protein
VSVLSFSAAGNVRSATVLLLVALLSVVQVSRARNSKHVLTTNAAASLNALATVLFFVGVRRQEPPVTHL